MFTGIIRHLGQVKSIEEGILCIESDLSSKLALGDSIAINGVCQTVIENDNASFKIEMMPETLRLTTLGDLKDGSVVNLETSLKIGEKLDGHLVFGHVDGIAKILEIRNEENARLLKLSFPKELSKYIAHKGSISIDGISLTVIDPEAEILIVSIVSHTWENTNLSQKQVGSTVNIEVDMLARYVEKMLNFK